MKIKNPEGLMLRDIAGSWVVVPVGEMVVRFNGLMTLSETGALLWKKLENGADIEELVSSLLSEFNVEESIARSDVQEFITQLSDKGVLE